MVQISIAQPRSVSATIKPISVDHYPCAVMQIIRAQIHCTCSNYSHVPSTARVKMNHSQAASRLAAEREALFIFPPIAPLPFLTPTTPPPPAAAR